MSTFNLTQTLGLLDEYDSDIGFDMNLGEEDEYSPLDMCRLDENNNDTNPVTIHVYDSTDTMPDIESGVSVTLQVNEIQNSSDPSAVGDQSQDMNNMSSDKAHTPTSRGRSRVRQKESWQKEVRKRKRQSGQEYVNTKGDIICAKRVKLIKDCRGKCRYKCAHLFNNAEIEEINKTFWKFTDDEKFGFYGQTTEKLEHSVKKQDSRRKTTYKYYFLKGSEKIQVCKEFYLGVLQISDSRVRRFYEKSAEGTQYRDMRGRFNKVRTEFDSLQYVRDHINSFARVPSHYCRSSTSKEYLESGLSVKMMYEMYVEKCHEDGKSPVKLSMYRHIFNTDFNISFQKPKKDRCDMCEEIKMANLDKATSESIHKYQMHEDDRCKTKMERDSDRASENLVICFDLENVISLPKADIKNFFYRRKLNTFNLTAHCSKSKTAYNAIWCEAVAGRGANEISSALVAILKAVKADHPDVKSYTLWSDSCVSQNRNSVMTFALKRFMIDNNVDEIIQKYSCPGHSAIQEVDNIHSQIEKVLRAREVFSPVSLVRVMKNVRRKAPFKVIQLQRHHFTDYQKAGLGMKFHQVPFTKVKCLRYFRNDQLQIDYKISFADSHYKQAMILGRPVTRSGGSFLALPVPRPLSKHPVLSMEKRKDLSSMQKYMCEIDRRYYEAMKILI